MNASRVLRIAAVGLLLGAVGSPAAAGLVISSPAVEGDAEAFLDPAHPGWERAGAVPLLLKETPRVYPTDPAAEHPPPEAAVRAVHGDGEVFVLLEWVDDTPETDDPPAPHRPELVKDELIHSRTLEAFADAASCQVPETASEVYPSLMMGSEDRNVLLAFWKAGVGMAGLRGKGRRQVERDDDLSFGGQGIHDGRRWRVTFRLARDPGFGSVLPVSFAVWDGSLAHRNGRKFFSPWYDLELR